ncbi:MAG: hypothetical protein O2904_00380 [bacterium]|nr:hypothetical protein [bacterium]
MRLCDLERQCEEQCPEYPLMRLDQILTRIIRNSLIDGITTPAHKELITEARMDPHFTLLFLTIEQENSGIRAIFDRVRKN